MPNERKPHLQKVKQEVVDLIDNRITKLKETVVTAETYASMFDEEGRRTIAIWVKERNRIARQAGIEPMPLDSKTNQGTLIWMGNK